MKPKLRRTWKRQLAVVSFGFWMIITTKLFFFTAVNDIAAYASIYSTVSLAIWAYIGGAFGLHAIQENGLPVAPTQPTGAQHAE